MKDLVFLQQSNLILANIILTEYVRKKVLRQTDGEIIEIDEQIEQEIRDGIIPDPNSVDPITGEPLPAEGEQKCWEMFRWNQK